MSPAINSDRKKSHRQKSHRNKVMEKVTGKLLLTKIVGKGEIACYRHLLLRKDELTLCKRINFRLFKTERVCRRQFYMSCKWQKLLQKGRKYSGERRNCLLCAISPFTKVFSEDLY